MSREAPNELAALLNIGFRASFTPVAKHEHPALRRVEGVDLLHELGVAWRALGRLHGRRLGGPEPRLTVTRGWRHRGVRGLAEALWRKRSWDAREPDCLTRKRVTITVGMATFQEPLDAANIVGTLWHELAHFAAWEGDRDSLGRHRGHTEGFWTVYAELVEDRCPGLTVPVLEGRQWEKQIQMERAIREWRERRAAARGR